MSAPPSDHGRPERQDAVRLKRLANLGVLEIAGDGQRTLVLSGKLDLASFWLLDCPLLQIGAEGSKTFTLDLSELTFIDSAGVRTVLAARGLCEARDCEFRLIAGPAHVQRVFELSGLINHLPFRSSRADVVGRT